MPEPAVVTAMQEFKSGLLARESIQMQEMARRWLQVEEALEAQISALTQELAQMKDAGEVISEARIYRLERYQRLLAQTQREFNLYTEYAEREILARQAELAQLGLDHATQAIQLSYSPGVGAYFDRLPVEAVENMVGLAGNGAPIGELLKLRMVTGPDGLPLPGVWDKLTESLIRGTALGWNPRKTARFMRDNLSEGLNKALTIARTEQLRVYREASRQQYQASGVVNGFRRLSARDNRVCIACLISDGQFYLLRDAFSDHPQGRCTLIPIVKNMPEPDFQRGREWLLQQPPEVQQQIMGKKTYDLWQKNKLDLSSLVSLRKNSTWGDSLVPTPVKDLSSPSWAGWKRKTSGKKAGDYIRQENGKSVYAYRLGSDRYKLYYGLGPGSVSETFGSKAEAILAGNLHLGV